MKSFIAASLMVFSSVVLAMPAVGDMATYNVSAQGMDFQTKIEVTALDAATDSITKVSTTYIFGQESTETESTALSEELTTETVNMILTYCETSQVNGKITAVTVPAGSFDTCAVSNSDSSTTYIGLVPFGVVKHVGEGLSLELTAYKMAE